MPDQIQQLEQELASCRERLNAARRAAPPEPVQDATLMNPDGTPVTLTELFGEHDELLVVHNMGQRCSYCTLWADGFNGLADHLANRCAFVLTSPDAPDVHRAFVASRAWRFKTASTHGTTFAQDLGFASASGSELPGVSSLRKQADGSIARVGKAPFGPGDEFCSVWPFFDLLSNGSNGWTPKMVYGN